VNEMKPRQWFQTRLRWAVLEEGRGLDHWREAEHIFLSEDREAAFQEALRIGYAGEYSLSPALDQEPAPSFDCRFAEVEYLKELGMGRTSFEVCIGNKPAREAIAFDHEFDPAAHVPDPIL
jgi:hypothetical protein